MLDSNYYIVNRHAQRFSEMKLTPKAAIFLNEEGRPVDFGVLALADSIYAAVYCDEVRNITFITDRSGIHDVVTILWLTDEEYHKLCKEYGNIETGKAITYLDEYIEMKGYKAKSHYLCIRKWVFDAVKRSNQQAGNTPKKHFGTERTDIDYAELLRSRVVN